MEDNAKNSIFGEWQKDQGLAKEEWETRILMLEDVPTDAELTERLLSGAGIRFTAQRVATEDAFKKALDFFDPDIILLDHELPHYSGALALEFAKESKPKVPCVFVSGSISDAMVVDLMRKGATDYVLKQNMDRLVPVIQRAIKEIASATRIDELNKLRSEFVHVVSHQLRTPFTVILWNLQTIAEVAKEDKSKIDSTTIEGVLDAATKISSRIEDMIIALSIAEGEQMVSKSTVLLEDILVATLSKLDYLIKKDKIVFDYRAPSVKLPEIKCDTTKMAYIFRKLIENAFLYTNDGGRVVASLERSEGGIRFEITDTGIGIPKDDQSRIFSSFFRAKNAELKSPDGSGVSLSVVKKYLKSEGGKVGFVSEEGNGSTFWFELPLE